MRIREIGRSGLKVAPLAFGGNVFGWTLDESASHAMLDGFVGAGFNLVDTADVYSRWAPGNAGGESEAIIGRWLASRGGRDRIILATKCGKPLHDGRRGLSPRHIERAVEDSLRRLRTDYIDLYQAHVDDPETPIEDTLAAFERLIHAGKIRTIGASNFSARRLAESLRLSEETGLPRYECLQPLYNLYDRHEYERELAPLCRQHGLGVLPYFSLAAGFLTGKYRTQADLAHQPRGGMVQSRLNERGVLIIEALDEVAEALGVTPASVAIAWLMQRPGVTAPLASATRPEHLDALITASRITLDAAALRGLEAASGEFAPARAELAVMDEVR